jgi:hypothetical protein
VRRFLEGERVEFIYSWVDCPETESFIGVEFCYGGGPSFLSRLSFFLLGRKPSSRRPSYLLSRVFIACWVEILEIWDKFILGAEQKPFLGSISSPQRSISSTGG